MTKKTVKAQGERTVMGFDFGTKSIGIAIDLNGLFLRSAKNYAKH